MSREDLTWLLSFLGAGLGLIALLMRGVRDVWRTSRRVNQFLDQVLGDKERQIPSMADRVKTTQAEMATIAETVRQHGERIERIERRGMTARR